MGIQSHVFHTTYYKELVPAGKPEAIVKDDGLLFGQVFAEHPVRFPVEMFQKTERYIAGALRLFFVFCFSCGGCRHINDPADGLIQHLDPIQAVPFPIPLSETIQHAQRKLHFFRILTPFAHPGETTIVIAVLAPGNRMQIQKDLQTVLFRPVKGFIHILNAAHHRRPVPEYMVGHRQPDHIQAVFLHLRKIRFRDIRITMLLQKSL